MPHLGFTVVYQWRWINIIDLCISCFELKLQCKLYVLLVEESALTNVSSDQLQLGCMWVNNFKSITKHEHYKSDDILCKNTFGVKRCGEVK